MTDVDAKSTEQELEKMRLTDSLRRIKHTVMVMSGKGGVGKSTVAANLATVFCRSGLQAGILDADVHGPSIPRLLGLPEGAVEVRDGALQPVVSPDGLKVMSVAYLVGNRDDAVIWRGPMKARVFQQLLADVAWGELDVLVVDLPPGTGDEPLSMCQLVPHADGAVVVTTPQGLAVDDVRRCVSFCRQVNMPILGVLENMSGFICPHCGEEAPVFGKDGGRLMAEEMGVPFLGALPLDPTVAETCDTGVSCALAENPGVAGTRLREVALELAGKLTGEDQSL